MATATLHVVIDPKALADELRGPNGSVVRELGKRATRVKEGGRKEAPKGMTQRLANGIVVRPAHGSQGHFFNVVSGAPHSLYVHGLSGRPGRTRPHFPPIAAVQPWAMFRGFPARGGGFLVARAIAKKGTPIIPFLVIAAKKEGLKVKVGG